MFFFKLSFSFRIFENIMNIVVCLYLFIYIHFKHLDTIVD